MRLSPERGVFVAQIVFNSFVATVGCIPLGRDENLRKVFLEFIIEASCVVEPSSPIPIVPPEDANLDTVLSTNWTVTFLPRTTSKGVLILLEQVVVTDPSSVIPDNRPDSIIVTDNVRLVQNGLRVWELLKYVYRCAQ